MLKKKLKLRESCLPVTNKQIKYLKQLKNNDFKKYEDELISIKKSLFKEHCPKSGYKDQCEAAYCVYAHTNTCEYLKEMNNITHELEV